MKLLYTHPDNPQSRHIDEIANELNNGKIAIIPTAIGYCFAISMGNKSALEKLIKEEYSPTILLCQELSQLSKFGIILTHHFRIIKSLGQTDIVFGLTATKDSPKYLQDKKTIHTQLANDTITKLLIEKLGEPVVIFALQEPLLAYEIEDTLTKMADYFIHIGDIDYKNLSMVDLSADTAVLIKEGDDDISPFFH